MTRLCLPEVMLCAITSIAIPETLEALERCVRQVEFGRVLLLTDQDPETLECPEIRHCKIEPIRSRQDYSEFVLRELVHHVDRPHVLLVQWDGFILDASRWQRPFLKYDYIGAVWPQFRDNYNVGNGGFSLRSRRLLELTSSVDFPTGHPEDVSICRTHRHRLEERGVRFAPAHVAQRFSFERGPRERTFGFHGLFNLPHIFDDAELAEFLERIDPKLLASRDGADLLIELSRSGMTTAAWRLAMRRPRRSINGKDEFRLWRKLATTALRAAFP